METHFTIGTYLVVNVRYKHLNLSNNLNLWNLIKKSKSSLFKLFLVSKIAQRVFYIILHVRKFVDLNNIIDITL